MTENPDDLQYGVSITDGCISWEDTQSCLRSLHDKLNNVLPRRLAARGDSNS
jgi:3-deoxy-7-phosphoheptulonate synthase